MTGILPQQDIQHLWDAGQIKAESALASKQLQPASLDLRLGQKAYRLRASFLPGASRTIAACLTSDLVMHEIDLSQGAVLEPGCVYLVPLQEAVSLDSEIVGAANPKSSTGRLDVFTRVITDNAKAFDAISPGYSGPLYVEIAPRTFSVLVRPGDTLVQIRFRRGAQDHRKTITCSVDLSGDENGLVGYRARRHAGLVNLQGVGEHTARDYWEPLHAPRGRLILDPGEFYILASKEAITIDKDEAAEMAPIATEIGEFRAHYAGFFDPGFGLGAAGGEGSRAVLEVRGRDVPFVLEDGQSVARLIYESMSAVPETLYGTGGSHYQKQGLKLSKHFRV